MSEFNVGELFGKSVESVQLQAEVQTLKHRNYQLEHDISDQREYIKHLENQIKQLSESQKEVRYKVARSYTQSYPIGQLEISVALKDGWEFVRASEYVPKKGKNGGYIEYILRKEVGNENK